MQVGPLRVVVGGTPDEPVVTLTGELDLASGQAAQAWLARLDTRTAVRVVLDCSGLSFVDVAGLRALDRIRRQQAVPVLVDRPSPALRRLTTLLGRPDPAAGP